MLRYSEESLAKYENQNYTRLTHKNCIKICIDRYSLSHLDKSVNIRAPLPLVYNLILTLPVKVHVQSSNIYFSCSKATLHIVCVYLAIDHLTIRMKGREVFTNMMKKKVATLHSSVKKDLRKLYFRY